MSKKHSHSDLNHRLKKRNPIAKALREDKAFKLKVINPKKKPPKEPTVEQALIELQEEEESTDEKGN